MRSNLPDRIQTIYVPPVKNAIDLSGEVTTGNQLNLYRPGLEVDLTNAIINRFIFDGNLKIGNPDNKNAVLDAKLVEYRRDPLRYTAGDDVQEYRLTIILDATVYEWPSRKVLWHERVAGDSSYFVTGQRILTEDEALTKVVEDTARRVVEKTIELW